ncbi:THO complex subunit 3 [Cinnamomum micranthum f. kanehirae]|uniref:THO complex subunit 3 n=1 Tax=Cinnamomum micranthum f. kanehirae TaxID=337451 RepID=A0A443NC97_9MAGN|nr:THO complex subunit 3 [Cinnamomum micranthum f. kanehirae]
MEKACRALRECTLFPKRRINDDELTILDVRKFKPIVKRKFNYEVHVNNMKFYPTLGNIIHILYLQCNTMNGGIKIKIVAQINLQ